MRTLRDVIAPDLTVLFCGINPGLYSAAVGHNFARPGNRFWRTLYGAAFTDRLFAPEEERELLQYGCGITNIVKRATASANELTKEELRAGARSVIRKVRLYKPQILAVVGLSAYRIAFAGVTTALQGKEAALPGLQNAKIGKTSVWVLPNPSGLNAHYQLPSLIQHFKELHEYAFAVG
jgi:double-stranded uracil-DNA glycosylase